MPYELARVAANQGAGNMESKWVMKKSSFSFFQEAQQISLDASVPHTKVPINVNF